jgi:hypothetical protein
MFCRDAMARSAGVGIGGALLQTAISSVASRNLKMNRSDPFMNTSSGKLF